MAQEATHTLHQRILADLRARILGGAWPPGHRLPVETDLAAAYGVSRMTANKALTQLQREGFIERRRKGGSFVAPPRARSAVIEIASIADEVRGIGARHDFALLSRVLRPAGGEDLARLGLPAAGAAPRVLAVDYLHRADGRPFCHEARIINLAAVPAAEDADLAAEPAGAWLLRQVPWSSADHTIRAVAPGPSVARLLGLGPSAPCLQVDRRTEFEGRPVTFARLTYPGALHQLTARFSPPSGGAGDPGKG